MITLTTDFGLQDHYVGTMKGVILSRCPKVTIIDISHGVRAFSVVSGAYTIAQAARYFPPGTIHVIVVDPGVGTARRAIAARVDGSTYVAPDNGVLSLILKQMAEVREITNDELFLKPVSSTFHGRDIFAPVGAALASGEPFETVGPPISDFHLLKLEPETTDSVTWQGIVLSVDQFGNVITNLPAERLHDGVIFIGGVHVRHRYKTFGEASGSGLFVYAGSSGFLEIGINRGRAAEALRIAPGDPVSLTLDQ